MYTKLPSTNVYLKLPSVLLNRLLKEEGENLIKGKNKYNKHKIKFIIL